MILILHRKSDFIIFVLICFLFYYNITIFLRDGQSITVNHIIFQMSKKKIDWISTLKDYVGSHPQRSTQEIDDETDKLFLNYIEEAKRKE